MIQFKLPVAAFAAISVLALSACEPVPGQENTNLQRGAAVGAGIGAVVGALSGDSTQERIENAAIGAVVLGGAGAIGGTLLDRQEAELRNQLGSNVGIQNTGDQLIVNLPNDILFAVDSATLTGQLQSDLLTVARSLNNYPNTRVTVEGHTDNTGSAEYNQDLSERRAQSVASVLISGGVSPSRITSIGRGENAPVASNLDSAGRALNRRVEIIITPTT
ncbi:OmpA family protein [Ponticoccus sp. SC2-23]|uniref:OmpA family protein n=1 Tax=Alexandriicola marinus TaxID=2081710 RepID=UPI000FD9593D|nr:OmpA family protein [Alexandriicola marinus]MBM1220301.1 OmpA family protein [Ponticoccus sp. SC6-9]MBM1224987.1 OmpA family protein [Ponticoccus sp. SC6-15]MBM1228501.1 OmpA family protein [Ponticoccus sp. SC6-38]MBM1233862.1 OmpA family protein [Ponticoccus sp. SC6-45]MBM1239002.1 OmpA family protein [Ponticoccus sp. SC6-49]MBM1242784.1 OmpA family protein [Ponticoccus sp. SC2-64]MBM1247386.1 OmpA family protein [Ponticoccus sp. SC6-42]MBM1251955.1 OmpA family protein [Ponticoccus sp. 